MASKEEEEEKPKEEEVDDDDHLLDHDFEIIEKDEGVEQEQEEEAPSQDNEDTNNNHKGLWIGIDLGTSNCACAIWDSNRGRPKWMRLKDLAPTQSNGKVGRIVPSAVQVVKGDGEEDEDDSALWQDVCKWNEGNADSPPSFVVGQRAIANLQEQMLKDENDKRDQVIIKSMKRVLGVCYTTKLQDLDPELRDSLPFELEETPNGDWVVPLKLDDDQKILYLKPVHVAAVLLRAIREAAKVYLKRAVPKKKLQVPGYDDLDDNRDMNIPNVVVGVPAYFGHVQRQAVEEAARLAGYGGHVSTLTESTAAAMAYGLFVGGKANKKAVLVLDMGGGTTDITIAHMNHNDSSSSSNNAPDQKFTVVLTDGDSRLGGEDMDSALMELVLQKAKARPQTLTAQQRQQLLRSCQQAKELLCGDVDHDDPPAESATVPILTDDGDGDCNVQLTIADLERAIAPLLDRTAKLLERTLKRYQEKTNSTNIAEAILIGGATRVPALRKMLQTKFFSDIDELCTSVNAMSAVAQGTAIQAAILSKQVPLHELQSAMMLDTLPHAIGVLIKSGEEERFVQVLARDASLPAVGSATFGVADLDQKGVTVTAVEQIEQDNNNNNNNNMIYQPLGEFTFLLHRLTQPQREAIQKNDSGLRSVEIGMTLGTDGAFQVSIFDPHDPDHKRKKEVYQKSKQDATYEPGLLDYVQAAADLKEYSITAEEAKLIVVVVALFIFYILVKVLLSKEDILSEEDMARIL